MGNSSPLTTSLGTPVELLNPQPDTVLTAWWQQMERNPMTLPPKNTQALPPSIFVSYDFICWLMRSVANLDLLQEAILFANKLVIEDKIRLLSTPSDSETCEIESHKISADSGEHPFRYGFFLYCIVHDQLEMDLQKLDLRGKIYLSLEQPCHSHSINRECRFRSKAITMEFCPSTSFMIRNQENLFNEWGKLVLDRAYTHSQAFEICVKWFMATGQTVADLVNKQWGRCAQKYMMHFFPAPEDAFAEPTNVLSSPLRCPIFVPIQIELIPKEQFDSILHSILMSFGFVLMRCPIHCRERAEMAVDSASLRIPIHVLQFVHLSGGMFVKYDINQSSFMWAWNHMLSQKYRTSNFTEEFLDFMLDDFRSFCKNQNDRLVNFVSGKKFQRSLEDDLELDAKM